MVILFLVAVVLSSSVFAFGREWNPDRNRSYWFCLLTGVAVIPFLPNLWLQGILTVMLLRLGWGTQPLERIKRLDDNVLLAATLALVVPYVTKEAVGPVLWALVLVGLWTSAYALVSARKFDLRTGYTLSVDVTRWYHLRFYDHSAGISAGQGNPNHLHGVCVISIAAACGLELIGSVWALLLVPLLVLPMFVAQFTKTDNPGHYERPQQGWIHLVVLCLAYFPLALGPWGWLPFGMLALLAGTVLVRNRHDDTGLDSGRGKLWWGMIQEWWRGGWGDRLFGWGAKEFENRYIQKVAREAQQAQQFIVAHHPHSEYVCCLVEHGLLGIVLVTGYLSSRLWLLLTAGPEGQALYLVAIVLCAVAFVSFPATWYHEILFRVENAPGAPPMANRLFTLGTPALFGITFVVIVLSEGLLR